MTNASKNEELLSICCNPDEHVPDDTFCYRNGTFSVWSIFASLFTNVAIAAVNRELICNGTIFDLETYPPNNDSVFLRGDGTIDVKRSVHDGTPFVLGPNDYCFTSRMTDYGKMAVISACDPIGGLNYYSKANAANNGEILSICCNPDEHNPDDTFCNRNGTFSVWSIFAKLFTNVAIAAENRELTCNGTIFDLESYPPNNDSFFLRKDGTIDVKKSRHTGTMEFVLGTNDYCLTSRMTDYGKMAVVSACDRIVGLNSMANAANNGKILTICCNPDEHNPDDTFCYRSGTFSVWSIFAKLYPDVAIAPMNRELTCNGTIFDLETYPPNNDSAFLRGDGTIDVKRSVHDGTPFVLGPNDYCFTSRMTDYGKMAVISACDPIGGLNYYSKANAANNGEILSICCNPDEHNPDDTFCNRNGTFSVWSIFASLFTNIAIAAENRELTCNGTIFNLESYPPNNDSFFLRKDGTINVKKSMHTGTMKFVLGTNDYCFTSRMTDYGKMAVISACDPIGGLNYYSKANAANNGEIIPICCNPDEHNPDDTFCYRSGTFSVWSIFAKLYPDVAIAPMNRELTCNGTIFDLETYPPNNDSAFLREDGTIDVKGSVHDGTPFVLGPNDYCFTSRMTDYGKMAVISACDPIGGLNYYSKANAANNGEILSICCNPDEHNPDDTFCYRNGTFSVWSIFDNLFTNVAITAVNRELTCNGTIFDLETYPPNKDSFFLRKDGLIVVKRSMYAGTMEFVLGTNDYCFTSRMTKYGKKAVVSVCDPMVSLAFTVDFSALGPQLRLIASGLSLPCLAATFLVYTIVPELKNVPGFTLRAYVATYFTLFTLYLTMINNIKFFCFYILAVITHFTMLAHYFWLNVMCFDIWWTFRRIRSVQSESEHANRKRCIKYSIFAWGGAALITVVGAIIDSVPTVPKGIIRPGLRAHCWFIEPIEAIVYYLAPMGVIIVCNICFFVATAITLIRHEKDTAHHLNENEEKLHSKENKRFHLYLKLFIIMGMVWITEIILWWEEMLPSYVALILDLPSSLQGVFIFVIFVCNEKTKKLLLKRLGRGEKTAVDGPIK